MKKTKLILFAFIVVVLGGLFFLTKQGELTFSNSIVQRIINKVPKLESELSKSTIQAYTKAIDESTSIFAEYKTAWCKLDNKKAIKLANNLRFLKEHKQAISFLKKFYACYTWTWETKFTILSTLGFIKQDMWDIKSAVLTYKNIIEGFGWNKRPFFGLSQEDDLKVVIKELEGK